MPDADHRYKTPLADATEKMKASAEKSAQSSRDFADTAGDIKGSIDTAVDKLDAQAKGIEQSRKSSEIASAKALNAAIESSRLDERAWMGVSDVSVADPSPEKGFPIAVVFINSGKTPANNAKLASGYHYSLTPVYGPSEDEIANLNSSFHSAQATSPQAKFYGVLGYLAANGDTSTTSALAGNVDSLAHFKSILEGQMTLYYYGTLKYDDVVRKPPNY